MKNFAPKNEVRIRELGVNEGMMIISTRQIEAVSMGDTVIHYYEYIAKMNVSGAITTGYQPKKGATKTCQNQFRYYLHMY